MFILQQQNLLRTICVVLVIMHSCAATLDLSNLNVNDFQFFRYQQRLPNGELKPVPPPSSLSIENHFHRAKAGKCLFYLHRSEKSIPLLFTCVWLTCVDCWWHFLVGAFLQRLLFGNTGDDAKSMPLVFPPTVDHLRERFERMHGYRGQYLIEQLGNGQFRYSSGYMPCYSCKHWIEFKQKETRPKSE